MTVAESVEAVADVALGGGRGCSEVAVETSSFDSESCTPQIAAGSFRRRRYHCHRVTGGRCHNGIVWHSPSSLYL